MAANTYVALSTQTVGTAIASVTFSSIPQGYTDLVLVANFATSTAGPLSYQVGTGFVDTTNSYSRTCAYGDGTSAASFRETNQTYFNTANSSTTLIANDIVQFMNYSNTTTNKTILNRNNNSTGTVQVNAYLWRKTTAIDTIKVFNANGYNIAAGSTFTIYGIAAAAIGAKATGGTIYSDSQYIYHVFTSTGAFIPTQALTTEVLAVAGGGGTSIVASGGGGAGGVLYSASTSFASGTTYTCTVGAGGTGVNNRDTVGSNGTNSTITGTGFTTLTAVGGGGGAGFPNSGSLAGGNGGSGGGGSGATGGTGGTATSGQGNVGGIGDPTSGVGTGGGGGGASVAGGNGSLGFSGSGGDGTSAYSSWLSVIGIGELVSGTYYIAGGGSGGAYNTSVARSAGLGGGGKGSAGTGATPGANGIDNTGGGAGGTGGITGATGAKGGSGLVIVRYPR